MVKQFLKFRLSKNLVVLTIGFILVSSGFLTLLAWYLAPALLPDLQTSRLGNSNPEISSIILDKTPLNKTVKMGELNVKVWTEPSEVEVSQEAQLFLEILDKSGNPVSLDTSIHYTKIHTYAIRNDLGDETIHLHPTETSKNSGLWKTFLTIPSAGRWNLVNQMAKNGVMYQLTNSIDTGVGENFQPDFSKNRDLGSWIVDLNLDKEIVKAGEEIKLTFDVAPKPGKDTPELAGNILDNGHNLILARRFDSLVWNQHGDSSVEKISAQAGIAVGRLPTDIHPFSHVVTFPKTGIWLLHFELQSIPAHFFIRVE